MYNPNPKMFSRGCGMEFPQPRFCGWVPIGEADGIFLPRPLVYLWRIWMHLKIKRLGRLLDVSRDFRTGKTDGWIVPP